MVNFFANCCARRSSLRRAFSLMELAAVLVILVVITGLTFSMRPQTAFYVGAQCDARRLAMDLLQTRRRAISTGDNHRVAFQYSAGAITGYTIVREATGGDTTVDQLKTFATGTTVTASPSSDPEFDFEGAAVAGNVITIVAGSHTYTVTVTQTTGYVTVTGS